MAGWMMGGRAAKSVSNRFTIIWPSAKAESPPRASGKASRRVRQASGQAMP